MTRHTHRTNIDPTVIRETLAYATDHGCVAAAARAGVTHRAVYHWRDRRELSGGIWPTDQDVADWHANRAATAARRASHRSYVARRAAAGGPVTVPALGTARRLRALQALGWRYSDMADVSAYTITYLSQLAVMRRQRVTLATAAKIRALFDQLSMELGPSSRTRAYAAAQGWAPPLAWDDDTMDDPAARPRRSGGRALTKGQAFDEIAIERAMAGDDVHLTPTERAEAVRRLTDKGLSAKQIALRLRITGRTAVRARSRETAA